MPVPTNRRPRELDAATRSVLTARAIWVGLEYMHQIGTCDGGRSEELVLQLYFSTFCVLQLSSQFFLCHRLSMSRAYCICCSDSDTHPSSTRKDCCTAHCVPGIPWATLSGQKWIQWEPWSELKWEDPSTPQEAPVTALGATLTPRESWSAGRRKVQDPVHCTSPPCIHRRGCQNGIRRR